MKLIDKKRWLGFQASLCSCKPSPQKLMPVWAIHLSPHCEMYKKTNPHPTPGLCSVHRPMDPFYIIAPKYLIIDANILQKIVYQF